MNLTGAFRNFCRKNQLVKNGDKIVIGISGGKDSVALAHLLRGLSHDLGLTIILAHFNHHLRKSADADENFVRKLAGTWGLEFQAGSASGKLRQKKGSLEENAREARIAFLIHLSNRLKADTIALAHTQDDLAETVLMRLIRGVGLKGLTPIFPKRTIGGSVFIRPLLFS